MIKLHLPRARVLGTSAPMSSEPKKDRAPAVELARGSDTYEAMSVADDDDVAHVLSPRLTQRKWTPPPAFAITSELSYVAAGEIIVKPTKRR